MRGVESSTDNGSHIVREKVNRMLNGRVLRDDQEPFSGYVPKGPETEGICGDCGDGACEGCP